MSRQMATQQSGIAQVSILTILRIILGFIVTWKAINFINATSSLQALIEQTGIGAFSENAKTLAFIVAYLSLLCGFFIVVGLVTRLASIVQIPVLVVAVFFVNAKHIEGSTFELVLSVVTLILLIVFAIKGDGPVSAAEYFRRGAVIDKRPGNAQTNYPEEQAGDE